MNIRGINLFLLSTAIFFGGIMEVQAAKKGKDFHVTKVVIGKPFDVTWDWIASPMKFKQLYPNWVSEITDNGNNNYTVTTPSGWTHTMIAIIDKSTGTIDFDINPGETSRSRLFSIDQNSTLHIHVATRHPQMPDEIWEQLKLATDRDYQNAKTVIEQN